MSELVLQCNHITQRFSGLVAVSDVSMEVRKNEIVGVIGPNGAGKTTLFNDITGIYKPTEGNVLFNGEDITGLPTHVIAGKGLMRTFQNIRLFGNMMVIDNVKVGLHSAEKTSIVDALFSLPRKRKDEKESEERAEEVLKLTGLYDFRYHYATSLPYGLQRRLEIARAMATDPKLLLLDETMAGLTATERVEAVELIRKINKMGIAILTIEHNMDVVMKVSNRVVVLVSGRLLMVGSPEEVTSNPEVISAYLGGGSKDES